MKRALRWSCRSTTRSMGRSDHVVRVNTRTGETVEYLLPRATNIRRVNVDNSTNPPTFWVGNNLGASIIKVEPLD